MSHPGNGRKSLALRRRLWYACGVMGGYRKTSHSVYDIKYHVVWITKYLKAGTQQGCWKKATRADPSSLYGNGHTDHQGTCE